MRNQGFKLAWTVDNFKFLPYLQPTPILQFFHLSPSIPTNPVSLCCISAHPAILTYLLHSTHWYSLGSGSVFGFPHLLALSYLLHLGLQSHSFQPKGCSINNLQHLQVLLHWISPFQNKTTPSLNTSKPVFYFLLFLNKMYTLSLQLHIILIPCGRNLCCLKSLIS